jgi:hypothetical protein
LVFIAATAVVSVTSEAQPSPCLLPVDPSQSSDGYRAFEDYCEGLYIEPRSGTELVVVDVSGVLDFDAGADVLTLSPWHHVGLPPAVSVIARLRPTAEPQTILTGSLNSDFVWRPTRATQRVLNARAMRVVASIVGALPATYVPVDMVTPGSTARASRVRVGVESRSTITSASIQVTGHIAIVPTERAPWQPGVTIWFAIPRDDAHGTTTIRVHTDAGQTVTRTVVLSVVE